MSSGVRNIHALCPEVDERVLQEHLDRVDADYLDRFGPTEIAEHVRSVGRLSADNPVEVLLQRLGERAAACTVLAYDHPFEFSLIAGVLASTDFRIDSGVIFTLPPARVERQDAERRSSPRFRRPQVHRHRGAASRRDPMRRWIIIDHFRGVLAGVDAEFDAWAEQTRTRLAQVIALLDRDDAESVDRAKHLVNELVTGHLAEAAVAQVQSPAIELEVDEVGASDARRTRLRIVGDDTPAFLYSISTALSLHGLCIDRVHISSSAGRVEDEIYLIDADGRPVTDARLIQRIKLSVILTKQFAYYLAKAPDPFTALTRFEQVTERITASNDADAWFELLDDPRTMRQLARLLGTSDYLWQDFIRARYEDLRPMLHGHLAGLPFCAPLETLPRRLAARLAGADDLAEKKKRLNAFKDHELFLIDLDHILTPGIDFRELSLRLTLLAENLVARAACLVYDDLVCTYGTPPSRPGTGPPADAGSDAERLPCAVFGLGKLGGVSLGYASDIELLFVYDADGQTTGAARPGITCTEFFELHVRETARFIRTKRAGIFEVDLRLRPHGNDGPLACSLEQFASYYGPAGPAHAFEKLALTRLRWLSGNPGLGFEIEQARDGLLYEGGGLDLNSLWEILDRQHAQKAEHGRLNAKYSPGALADLEFTLHLLQVMHAARVPQLRTPRLREVLEGLRRAEIVSPEEYAELVGTYYFLRRLINALRMLRGNAQDLFMPPVDDREHRHLVRRMGDADTARRDAGGQLIAEFEQRTRAVRAFIERRFGRPCPGT